jgi:hypothetical protein
MDGTVGSRKIMASDDMFEIYVAVVGLDKALSINQDNKIIPLDRITKLKTKLKDTPDYGEYALKHYKSLKKFKDCGTDAEILAAIKTGKKINPETNESERDLQKTDGKLYEIYQLEHPTDEEIEYAKLMLENDQYAKEDGHDEENYEENE